MSDSDVDTVVAHAEPPGDWSDDGSEATWPFTVTHAQAAWDLTHGSDVKVGIVDFGLVFNGHEDLDVIRSLGDGRVDYHATHTAGTACAKANGKGLVGFAWGCQIITSAIADKSAKAVLEAVAAAATLVPKSSTCRSAPTPRTATARQPLANRSCERGDAVASRVPQAVQRHGRPPHRLHDLRGQHLRARGPAHGA